MSKLIVGTLFCFQFGILQNGCGFHMSLASHISFKTAWELHIQVTRETASRTNA